MDNRITVFWEFALVGLAIFAAGVIWWILKEGKEKYDDCQRRLDEKDSEIRRLNEQQQAVATALMISAGGSGESTNIMVALELARARMAAEEADGD